VETPPELAALEKPLVDGLADALRAGAPDLDDARSRAAAEQVIRGQALPDDVARLFGDRPVCTLVGFDADAIQSWVFDSERVQVASGASHVLDKLNRQVNQQPGGIVGEHGIRGVLYSAGGGGVLFAEVPGDPEALVRTTRDWLEARSHELTFTVVAANLCVADLAPSNAGGALPAAGPLALDRFRVVGGIRGALVRLQVAMRDAKDARPRPATARVDRKKGETRAERCPSCGRRPPGKRPVLDASPGYWCEWCRGLRKVYLDRPENRRKEDDKAVTFADLAESVERRRQYLGFIAVDGNSMGAVVQSVGSLRQLRAFSEATTRIYEAARQRAREVLRPYLKDVNDEEESSLSLLSGGDEITLVLPAAAAPEVALEVLEAIERGFDQATGPDGLLHEAFKDDRTILERLRNAGAAAGVIAAHANYPVRLLRRYANELQKNAKSTCPRPNRSAVSWLLLTDSSPLTEKLEASPGDEDWSVAAFRRRLREVKLAVDHKVAASALQAILGYCRDEERSIRSLAGNSREGVVDLLAANFFRYQLARNDALGNWWQALVADDPDLRREDDQHDSIGRWFHRGGRRRLEQIVDLLSLQPFVEDKA
jgi:hypothetical protein